MRLNRYWTELYIKSINWSSLTKARRIKVECWHNGTYTKRTYRSELNSQYSRHHCTIFTRRLMRVWGFQGGEDSCHGLLGYGTAYSYGRIPTFRRILLLPSSLGCDAVWCCGRIPTFQRTWLPTSSEWYHKIGHNRFLTVHCSWFSFLLHSMMPSQLLTLFSVEREDNCGGHGRKRPWLILRHYSSFA
jgi:hypothetical protein